MAFKAASQQQLQQQQQRKTLMRSCSNRASVGAMLLPRSHAPSRQLQRCTPRHISTIVASSSPSSSSIAPSSTPSSAPKAHSYTCALLFDCDGVIVETEELHRKAYNAAFDSFNCSINGHKLVWSVEYYDVLQNTVGGGKPKMRYHFTNNGWPASSLGPAPESEEDRNRLIDALQDKKTEHYKSIVDSAAEARPGVLALMDEGLGRSDVAMCICSAATKAGFVKVVNSVVKPDRLARFDVVLAGDDVTLKKPDPLIYNMARERLGLSADRCVVIEDSMVGLRAAVAAGMQCIITPTSSTATADFKGEGATAVIPTLAGPGYQITIDDIFSKIDGETRPHVRLNLSTN